MSNRCASSVVNCGSARSAMLRTNSFVSRLSSPRLCLSAPLSSVLARSIPPIKSSATIAGCSRVCGIGIWLTNAARAGPERARNVMPPKPAGPIASRARAVIARSQGSIMRPKRPRQCGSRACLIPLRPADHGATGGATQGQQHREYASGSTPCRHGRRHRRARP